MVTEGLNQISPTLAVHIGDHDIDIPCETWDPVQNDGVAADEKEWQFFFSRPSTDGD